MASLRAAQHERHAQERQGHWPDLQDGARRRLETALNLSEEFSMGVAEQPSLNFFGSPNVHKNSFGIQIKPARARFVHSQHSEGDLQPK